MKMEQTEFSETSKYKIQMPGNYLEESIQHSEYGESMKSIKLLEFLSEKFQQATTPRLFRMFLLRAFLDQCNQFLFYKTNARTCPLRHVIYSMWQELDYRFDICRVTKGGHIEHL
jgi:hypothetical protein